MDFLIAFVWLIVTMAFTVWWSRAQMQYLLLYRTMRNIRMPLTAEDYETLSDIGSMATGRDAWNATFEPQPEPELEALRRRANRRYRIAVAIGLGGMFIVVILWGIVAPAPSSPPP